MRPGNATGFAGPSGISSTLSDYVQDFFSFLLKGEQRGMRESPFLLVFTNPILQATRVPFSLQLHGADECLWQLCEL